MVMEVKIMGKNYSGSQIKCPNKLWTVSLFDAWYLKKKKLQETIN